MPRFLLIEDCVHEAAQISAQLRVGRLYHRGLAEFVIASTMREAKAALAEKQFDAILLDLSLPDSGPDATLSTLMEHYREWPPVLVVTNDVDPATETVSLLKGAAAFIDKPTLAECPDTAMRLLSQAMIRGIRDRAKVDATVE